MPTTKNLDTEEVTKIRRDKLYEVFKKHGIERNNQAILQLKEILGPELQKTTLEEVRKNAWRAKF